MIKKMMVGLIGLVALALGFAGHEWYADKPFLFRAFLDREVVKLALDDPETLTTLGVLESVGIHGHNAHLSDAGTEREDKIFATLHRVRETLAQYEEADLSPQERLTKQIATYLLDTLPESEHFRFHNYPVNQLFGIQNELPSFLDSEHQIHTWEDGQDYLSRLSEVKRKFVQVREGLDLRESKGILPPRFVVDRVLAEMQAFVDQPAQENILYTSAREKIAKSKEWDSARTETFLAALSQTIQEQVKPAYGVLIDYFEEVRHKTGTDDGLWHLPEGDRAYALALKLNTTTDMTAEEIHQIGLTEVERIQSEITALLAQQGEDVSGGFRLAIDRLAEQPRFYYEDSDAGRAQILQDYQSILDEVDQGLGQAFNLRPKAGMEVRRIPQFKEKTAPGAYYQPPSMDGSRPGLFFANLYNIRATPRYAMRTLAYHEGIPGHHFQISIAMEEEGLPLFRRFPLSTAYSEGWALYTERLAAELGFEQDPYDNIGRLLDELFRAVRLVVDTGIHYKRWPREQAITYMLQNTGMTETDVVAEVERYVVLPGQATAYKIGMMKFLALREKMKAALGDRFKLADFHDVVLKNGAVPLAVLEQLVDDYIAKNREG